MNFFESSVISGGIVLKITFYFVMTNSVVKKIDILDKWWITCSFSWCFNERIGRNLLATSRIQKSPSNVCANGFLQRPKKKIAYDFFKQFGNQNRQKYIFLFEFIKWGSIIIMHWYTWTSIIILVFIYIYLPTFFTTSKMWHKVFFVFFCLEYDWFEFSSNQRYSTWNFPFADTRCLTKTR